MRTRCGPLASQVWGGVCALLVCCTPGPSPDPLPSPSGTASGGFERIDRSPPKIGLVLGGGGARGFAHVGVLRALEREKVPIHLVVGTSVGSLIGALYAADPNSLELEWLAMELTRDDIFDFSLFAAPTGPVKGDAVQMFVRKHIKEPRIEAFPIPFVAIATDLHTGKRVEIDRGLAEAAVRASVSLPGIFSPFRAAGRTLVDGGVVANLAVDVARQRGADIVIAVNITDQVEDPTVTNVVSIIMQSINIMMAQMAEQQLRDADVVITPDVAGIGTLDFGPKKRCVRAGWEAGIHAGPAIREAIRRHYDNS